MYVKIISLTNETLDYFGGTYVPNEFVDIPDTGEEAELYTEIETKIEQDKMRVSLDQDEVFDKDLSLKYMRNYTRNRKEYRLYDYVFGQTRKKDLGDIDYDMELGKSLFYEYTFKFGRKLQKIGYWYINGTHDNTKPVIRIDYNYSFDIAGLVKDVEKCISYYKKDNTVEQDVKITIDPYNYIRKGEEQIKRRENIYTEITGLTQNALLNSGQYTPTDIETIAGTFIFAISDMVKLYINDGVYSVIDLLRDNTYQQIETALGVTGLEFLDLDYNGTPLKTVFVALLDYRTPENNAIAAVGDVNTGLQSMYSGSLL